jgi:hypothetical protein
MLKSMTSSRHLYFSGMRRFEKRCAGWRTGVRQRKSKLAHPQGQKNQAGQSGLKCPV